MDLPGYLYRYTQKAWTNVLVITRVVISGKRGDGSGGKGTSSVQFECFTTRALSWFTCVITNGRYTTLKSDEAVQLSLPLMPRPTGAYCSAHLLVCFFALIFGVTG